MHVRGRLDLGQIHRADPIASGFDHVHDVAIAPRRIDAVDAHAHQPSREVQGAQRLDDDCAGSHFLRRCRRVFEVEQHLVCGERGRFDLHARAAAGHR